MLQLETALLRFQQQLEFSQRIRHLMNKQHREVYDRSLVMFQSKLEILRSLLQDVANPTAPDSVKRVKYLWNKRSISEAVKDLETWQALTD